MRTNKRFTVIVLALLFAILSSAPLLSADQTDRYRADEILVKFKPGTPAQRIIDELGVSQRKVIPRIDVHCLTLPPGLSVSQALTRFRKNPNVLYATPNHIVRVTVIPNDELLSFQWGLYNPPPRYDVHAPEAWNISTGSPDTIIAIVDTGIDSTHPDLEAKVIPGYNAIDGSSNTEDDHMHGTFVGAIAAASTNNFEGVAGMDWHARLMPVKVISGSGYGDEADAADGIIWAADNGAHIINMSFGAYADGENEPGLLALEQAVDYAWEKGSLLVAASGNDNMDDADGLHYPSCYANTISVGGTDMYDQRWLEEDWWTGQIIGGSNYGDTLDVMAPSSMILSAVPMWYYYQVGTLLGEPYEFAAGTSAAAPFVSGLAGLIRSVLPNWTNQQITDLIKQTCDDLESPGWDRYTGWGRINAYRALTEAFEDYSTISELRSITLNSYVRLPAKPVTAGTAEFIDRFYISETDRFSGIMVYYGSNVTTPTAINDLVVVKGRLSIVDGQLAITQPSVSITGTTDSIKPLGVRNQDVGGARMPFGGVTQGTGLANTGLLLTTWGEITAIGWNYFYIDDGSKLRDGSGFSGIRIFTGGLTLPQNETYTLVTGISTIEVPWGTDLRIPVIRPRTQSDIVVLP